MDPINMCQTLLTCWHIIAQIWIQQQQLQPMSLCRTDNPVFQKNSSFFSFPRVSERIIMLPFVKFTLKFFHGIIFFTFSCHFLWSFVFFMTKCSLETRQVNAVTNTATKNDCKTPYIVLTSYFGLPAASLLSLVQLRNSYTTSVKNSQLSQLKLTCCFP